MRKLAETVPSFIKDIRKRAAREFAGNGLTKEEFDKVFLACDMLTEVSTKNGKVSVKNESAKESKRPNAKSDGNQKAKGTA